MSDSVVEWFKNKNVLITGATGFMGIILVEKLLRSCPEIGTLFIVVRPKYKKDPQERLAEILQSPVFDLIKRQETHEKTFSKIQCLNGDVSVPNLGLSETDLNHLQSKCNILFHMAASVRFDQPLKPLLNMNLGGTLNVLELACTFQHLECFLHTSTTYCQIDEPVLMERLYKARHPPRKVLEMTNWLEEDLLNMIAPGLLRTAPNTYAYSKCLSEELVAEYGGKLPIVILRPSIVTPTLKEPMPGWAQNLNGPTGIIVGAGKGLIRSMLCNKDFQAESNPVDVTINATIIAAWDAARNPNAKDTVSVVNSCKGDDNPLTWGESVEIGEKHLLNNPFSVVLWYPQGSPKTNYIYHMFCVIFLQLLPAYILDFLFVIFQQKPFLVKAQKRILTGLKMLEYYTIRDWKFSNAKLKRIAASLSEEERNIFYTDINEISWDEYILNYVLGIRKYCVKEDPSTLPAARRTLFKLYCLDLAVKTLFFGTVAWFICSHVYSYMAS